MTSDKRSSLNTQISEEAAEWFIEFRTGEVDAAGRAAFDEWVRRSPEHLRAYVEIAAIWNEGSSVDAQRTLDIETLTTRARAEGNLVPLNPGSNGTAEGSVPDVRHDSLGAGHVPPAAQAPTVSRSVLRPRTFAIAASLLAALAGASVLTWFHFYGAPTYATEPGEQRTIRLADGSTVEMNSRSRVRIEFTNAERTVELLDGQALFRVAKNPSRPFTVVSGDTRVRAVGTQFDVYKKRDGTTVTVIEGRVAVLAPGQTAQVPPDVVTGRTHQPANAALVTPAVFLSTGEQVTISARTAPQPIRTNVAVATAWTQGQLVLESATLSEAAEEFNRYGARRLTVRDSGVHPLRLSGVFSTDPDFLIRYLKARADITVHETEREVQINRRDTP
jgi:transmembrane sensor